MNYLLLFLFGSGVGLLSGLLGIGGGIALVPGLMLLFGFSQPEAQGTSLAVMIPPIGIFAALVYYQYGYVRIPIVGWVALGFILGAFVGARFVPYIPVATLRVGFGVLLLYTGFMFVLSPGATRPAAVLPAGLATMVATVVARILHWRWRPPRNSVAPPGSDLEYHI